MRKDAKTKIKRTVAKKQTEKLATTVKDKLAERGISREWMKKHLIIDIIK